MRTGWSGHRPARRADTAGHGQHRVRDGASAGFQEPWWASDSRLHWRLQPNAARWTATEHSSTTSLRMKSVSLLPLAVEQPQNLNATYRRLLLAELRKTEFTPPVVRGCRVPGSHTSVVSAEGYPGRTSPYRPQLNAGH